MFFGRVPIEDAMGGTAVHSIRQQSLIIKKGTRIGPAEVAALRAAGMADIVVVKSEPGDVAEDEAAARIAAAVAGPATRIDKAFTGRANLFAEAAGILIVDRAGVDALNMADDAVTLATLPAYAAVEPGEMIATVKIIPFAVGEDALGRALDRCARPLVTVRPFRPMRVAVISTLLPGLKDSTVSKTLAVLAERLRPAGATIVGDRRVPHRAEAVAAALTEVPDADLVIVFGASAIADRRDVIPEGVESAGGRIVHLGMPVDPGNLLLLADLEGRPVLGAPGCARSPKENGFDWVLHRILADMPVTRADITGMGVGGLLMEIVSRPQPRAGAVEADQAHRVGAIVLAAGQSTRMGGPNKLLADVGGQPVVRHVAAAALASKAAHVAVVTGHQDAEVRQALEGLPLAFAHNAAFREGLSGSVRAGLDALPADCDAALICLGDMPGVDAALLDRLMEAFAPPQGALIVVPTLAGHRGNPVLWARRFFDHLRAVEGDTGGRQILKANADAVVEVPVETDAVAFDLDTPEALAAWRARLAD